MRILIDSNRFIDFCAGEMEVVDAFEQAVWLDPNDMDSQRNHGIALERLGRHHDAVFVYQLGIINGIEVEPSLKATLTKGLTRAKKQAEGQRGRV